MEEDSESPLTKELREPVEGEQHQPTDTRKAKTMAAGNKPHKSDVTRTAALDVDSFMLDGFDFSTGM